MRSVVRFFSMLFAASVIIFLLLRAVPGDPARIALGVTASDEDVAKLANQLGTDKPLVQQYFNWIGGMVTGNFGTSLTSKQDITPLVLDRMQVLSLIHI